MSPEDIKYTNQRIEILKVLEGNTDHPTVEDVYNKVKQKLTRITKATVYNNLQLLATKGIIKEVDVKGVLRLEPNVADHHHLICKSCGKIIDFNSEKLTKIALDVAKDVQFEIESTITNYYGLCLKCMEEKKNG